MNILTIPVDGECSAELIEGGIQTRTEAVAIRKDREELDRDRVAFSEKAPEDFVFGEADGFRDRTAALLVRELRLRQRLTQLDIDHRRELARLLDSRAMPELRTARASLGKELTRLGFPPEAVPGETDRTKILLGKLIDSHPRVVAAVGRIEQLRQKTSSRDFALQNGEQIKAIQTRIKGLQEKTALV